MSALTTLVVSAIVVVWIAVLFFILAELLRRPDLGSPAKIAWTAVIVIVPLIGGLAYLITDVVRRDDLSGAERLLWVVLMVVLPVIGMITYLITSREIRKQRRREPPRMA
jgi:hypothetical protein